MIDVSTVHTVHGYYIQCTISIWVPKMCVHMSLYTYT